LTSKKRRDETPGPVPRLSVFQDEFREDLEFWVQTDRRTALRLLKLVEAVVRDPFQGIGKPEPIKHLGSNIWSRRITQEHRLVYLVRDDRIDFLMGRYHY
jgi:toxin YoeB